MSGEETPRSQDTGQRAEGARDGGRVLAGRVFIHRAPHVGSEFDAMITLAAQTVRAGPYLHRVAHHSSGVYDFSVDVLDDAVPPPADPDVPVATRRASYQRAGQQLTFIVGREDRALEELRCGRLIRTVLHSDRGAIYCTPVRPAEYITGLTLDPTRRGVDGADQALAGLVTGIRSQLGMGSQNPGGWQTSRPASAASGGQPGPGAEGGGPSTPEGAKLLLQGEESQRRISLFYSAVNPADLHYAAYYRDGKFVSSADCLDDRSLAYLFTQIAPEARRRSYGTLGGKLKVLAGQFGHLTRSAIKGWLVRAVLDVEQGAIYYYRLPGEAYLVGVTLSQPKVSEADYQMERLSREFTELTEGT